MELAESDLNALIKRGLISDYKLKIKTAYQIASAVEYIKRRGYELFYSQSADYKRLKFDKLIFQVLQNILNYESFYMSCPNNETGVAGVKYIVENTYDYLKMSSPMDLVELLKGESEEISLKSAIMYEK